PLLRPLSPHLPAITLCALVFSRTWPPPLSTLFPYTTLFRSQSAPPFSRQSRSSAASRFTVSCSRDGRAAGRSTALHSSSKSSDRSEEHTSELQSRVDLVCRLLLEKKKETHTVHNHYELATCT